MSTSLQGVAAAGLAVCVGRLQHSPARVWGSVGPCGCAAAVLHPAAVWRVVFTADKSRRVGFSSRRSARAGAAMAVTVPGGLLG